MSEYYYHSCAVKLGRITPTDQANLTGTSYQLEKFIKHTAPTGKYSINSIFDDPSYSSYRTYIVNGQVSGCLEIDDEQRSNLIWYAGEQVGLTYSYKFVVPASGVRIAWRQDATKIHAFPCDPPVERTCKSCGRLIPY